MILVVAVDGAATMTDVAQHLLSRYSSNPFLSFLSESGSLLDTVLADSTAVIMPFWQAVWQ